MKNLIGLGVGLEDLFDWIKLVPFFSIYKLYLQCLIYLSFKHDGNTLHKVFSI